MKNSAWYHKLWGKRLSELPLMEDENTAWANMRNLLDERLPVNPLNTPASPSSGFKLFRGAVYFVATAAIIGTAVYMLTHWTTQTSATHINKTHPYQSDTSILVTGQLPGIYSNQKDTGTKRNSSTIENFSSFKPNTAINNSDIITTSKLAAVNARKTIGNAFGKDLHATNNLTHKHGNILIMPKVKNSVPTGKIDEHFDTYDLLKSNSFKQRYGKKRYSSHQQSESLLTVQANGFSSTYKPVKKVYYSSSTAGIRTGLTAEGTIKLNQQQTGNNKTDVNDGDDSNKPEKAAENAVGSSKIDMGKPVNSGQQDKKVKNDNSGKSQKLPGAKTVKNNAAKSKQQTTISNPLYNYGLEAGLNSGHGGSNLYIGGLGSYALSKRLLLSAGIRLNIAKSASGNYSRASYYRPDSLPSFRITDSRKLIFLDIPLTLEYRLSNLISINAGPVISIPLKQLGIKYKYEPIVDERDTVYHTKTIDSTMRHTNVSKVNFGGTVGITFRIKQFNINARYQIITPYKLSNGFGSYNQSAKSFQIGIGYRFR